MIKRYSATSQEYDIHLQLSNGKAVVLDFIGKDSVTKLRFVDVKDPLIIEALEKSPAFGANFSLMTTISDEQAKNDVIIETQVSSSIKEKEKAPEAPGSSESTITTNGEFPTLKEAKAWLNKEHGIPFNKMIHQSSVEKEFEKLNIKLVITKN